MMEKLAGDAYVFCAAFPGSGSLAISLVEGPEHVSSVRARRAQAHVRAPVAAVAGLASPAERRKTCMLYRILVRVSVNALHPYRC